MKTYGIVMSLIALGGIAFLVFKSNSSGLGDGIAGRAFTESEDGRLIEADGTRSNVRTVVQAMESPKGSDAEWLKEFELIERSGVPVASEQLHGTPYIAGFFFSTCPSICVRQNSKVQELQERFKDQQVRFLSISCDPEVDQPEVLQEYAKKFDADADQWLFLTGKMDYIRKVGVEVFRLGVTRRGHPEKFALMDANGDMFGLYTWSDEGQFSALIEDIEKLLAAGGTLPTTKTESDWDPQESADTLSSSQEDGEGQ